MTEPKEGVVKQEHGESSVVEKDTRSFEDRAAAVQLLLTMSREAHRAISLRDIRTEQYGILKDFLSEKASREAGRRVNDGPGGSMVIDGQTAQLSMDTLQRFRGQWSGAMETARKEKRKLQEKESVFSVEENGTAEAKRLMKERDDLVIAWQSAENVADLEIRGLDRAIKLKEDAKRQEDVEAARQKIDSL